VTDPTLTEALSAALAALDRKPEDAAAVALARLYAARLDSENADLVKEGPLLLSVLESLGMTPKGRAAVLGKGGGKGAPPGNRLDELRAKRRARANGAAPVDSSAS
jgi:hypothetical protein